MTVSLLMRDGSRLSRTVTASPGSPADPLTPEQLGRKWLDCLRRPAPGIDGARAERLLAEGGDLASMPGVRPWLAALRAAVREG